jgi:hypothetical protein
MSLMPTMMLLEINASVPFESVGSSFPIFVFLFNRQKQKQKNKKKKKRSFLHSPSSQQLKKLNRRSLFLRSDGEWLFSLLRLRGDKDKKRTKEKDDKHQAKQREVLFSSFCSDNGEVEKKEKRERWDGESDSHQQEIQQR